MRNIHRIIIHCAATPPSMDIGADKIRDWHLAQGWRDIGYHYVIKRDGIVEAGRPVSQRGAHCKGFNDDSIGICLVGGVDEQNKPQFNFTAGQMERLFYLTLELQNLHPGCTIHGHNEFSSKACPSFNVAEYFK